MFINSKNVNR